MSTPNKYIEENNSDELSRRFHDRAVEISKDFNKQLLTLSKGIIGAFFLLVFNKKDELLNIEKSIILFSIVLFGLSIWSSILGMQWEASKNYYLGHINDSSKQNERNKYEKLKRNYNTKQLSAKKASRVFFLLGIFSSITLLAIYIYSKRYN